MNARVGASGWPFFAHASRAWSEERVPRRLELGVDLVIRVLLREVVDAP